jgi:hypothetical protein
LYFIGEVTGFQHSFPLVHHFAVFKLVSNTRSSIKNADAKFNRTTT